MMTLHQRRRLAQTIHGDANKHAQTWRDQQAANDDAEDDALRAAKGILAACAIGAVVWVVFVALGWWFLDLLAQ